MELAVSGFVLDASFPFGGAVAMIMSARKIYISIIIWCIVAGIGEN